MEEKKIKVTIQEELKRLMQENEQLEKRLMKTSKQMAQLQTLSQAIQTNIVGNNGAIQSLSKISQQNLPPPLTPLNPKERKKKVKEETEEKQEEETENESKWDN